MSLLQQMVMLFFLLGSKREQTYCSATIVCFWFFKLINKLYMHLNFERLYGVQLDMNLHVCITFSLFT
jgi:hypothetical protein